MLTTKLTRESSEGTITNFPSYKYLFKFIIYINNEAKSEGASDL